MGVFFVLRSTLFDDSVSTILLPIVAIIELTYAY